LWRRAAKHPATALPIPRILRHLADVVHQPPPDVARRCQCRAQRFGFRNDVFWPKLYDAMWSALLAFLIVNLGGLLFVGADSDEAARV
jgi:hypothetical protein